MENKWTRNCNYQSQIIDLFIYKFYVGPHKGGFEIINDNPWHTYCPLVPKQHTFSATKGSPQFQMRKGMYFVKGNHLLSNKKNVLVYISGNLYLEYWILCYNELFHVDTNNFR